MRSALLLPRRHAIGCLQVYPQVEAGWRLMVPLQAIAGPE
jgi:hypothetical protein